MTASMTGVGTSLQQSGVEQRDRRVDDGITVLQGGLKHRRCLFGSDVDLSKDVQQAGVPALGTAAAYKPVSNR